jgi:hypothetical protein
MKAMTKKHFIKIAEAFGEVLSKSKDESNEAYAVWLAVFKFEEVAKQANARFNYEVFEQKIRDTRNALRG